MGTGGTPVLRVVDLLLMQTAYNSIDHDDRLGVMIPHELEDLACKGGSVRTSPPR